jgi:phosphoribosylaminoimidazole-succinocarboxamide synthase
METENQEVITETHLGTLLHKGKVRDTYDLGAGYLLMVATDRISAFDLVLGSGIPEKGSLLCEISSYWFDQTKPIVPNHLITLANRQNIPKELNGHPILENLSQPIKNRSMIVKRAQRIDIECVVRGYITGSAWAEYKTHGTVGGDKMPSGLLEGDRFPEPLFTPTTKAEEGHDLPMTMDDVENMVGTDMAKELKQLTIGIYNFAHLHAHPKGIILADTKMEFGILNDEIILIDELITPDSSRFWDVDHYKPGQSQPNFDKQFVRDWLNESGWDKNPPGPALPNYVIQKTHERYIEAFERLTGTSWNTST